MHLFIHLCWWFLKNKKEQNDAQLIHINFPLPVHSNLLLIKKHKRTRHNHCFPSCRNHMESLPDWLCEAKKLEVLDVSHNIIAELPPWWVTIHRLKQHKRSPVLLLTTDLSRAEAHKSHNQPVNPRRLHSFFCSLNWRFDWLSIWPGHSSTLCVSLIFSLVSTPDSFSWIQTKGSPSGCCWFHFMSTLKCARAYSSHPCVFLCAAGCSAAAVWGSWVQPITTCRSCRKGWSALCWRSSTCSTTNCWSCPATCSSNLTGRAIRRKP